MLHADQKKDINAFGVILMVVKKLRPIAQDYFVELI